MSLETARLSLVPCHPAGLLTLLEQPERFEQEVGVPAAPGLREMFTSSDVSPDWFAALRASRDPDPWRHGFFLVVVYQYMWGPSEFTATGTLKHFDGTAWLRAFKVPTLFVAGEFDEATPASTERFSKLVPGAEFRVIPNSGHSTENDNPDALLRTVREFLRKVERASR